MPKSSKQGVVKRQNWNKSDMEKAIDAIRSNSMGYKKACKLYGVPKTTLMRLAKNLELTKEEAVKIKLGRPTILPRELENELVQYLLQMENSFFGFTRSDVQRMAFQLAEKNGIKHNFNQFAEKAGKDWLNCFMSRHSDKISFRKPTGTSFARSLGFNRKNVDEFFDILENVITKYNIQANNIWNVDETGLTVVQSKIPHVIGRKGKKQIGCLTSAERGSLITIVICMSAGGQFVPPMMIFPRKKNSPLLGKDVPPGTLVKVHPSGWIQVNLFTEWFKHFIDFTKPSETSPTLLILDGHYSHTKNIEVINLARNNHVHIISLPPHATHKMQPTDKTFMGALKAHYSENIRQFLFKHQRPVTQIIENAGCFRHFNHKG